MKDCPSQTIVLSNPFPPHQQQAIAQSPPPLLGSNAGHQPQGTGKIPMLNVVNLQTRAKTYDSPSDKSITKEPPPSQPDGSLHIEKLPLT